MNQRQSILIIEDDKINRTIIKKVLEQYNFVEAENGQAGLEALKNHNQKISAILLDLTMPVMNGYDFLKEIKNSPWSKIPILVMTGDADVSTEKKVLDLGAWDFVSKPYNPQILIRRLVNAISRSQVDVYKELNHMTEHDPLTGLHNRQKMFANTKKMLETHPDREFIFLKADLDHFSLYNTTFGEEEGNKLLIHYANLMREFCDVYELHTYGRISGDIFCACIPWDGDAKRLSRKVEELNEKIDAIRKDYVLAVSVGACVVEAGMKVEDLYHRASFGAKKCKNRYGVHIGTYSEREIELEAEQAGITNDMQKALDDEQFVVYIQPKFNLSTDHVCGGEALIRWEHPEKGLISPGVFIPVFEQNGFVTKVDYYVWEHTCKRLRKWIDEGYRPDPISVNISRVSLYNPNLDKVLIHLVEQYDLPTRLLELEITESAYMTSPELMNDLVRKLHEAGFVILMDDFGSDYSSLNTLKNMDIDVLKIDMKFIPHGEDVEKGEIIIASMIKMAKWLGLTVICEGVETRRQRDFLEGAGCDIIQGYFYSRPIPKDEYETKYILPQKTEDEEGSLLDDEEGKVTILIIDDAQESCDILKTYFENRYNVEVCNSAEDGLIYLRRNPDTVKLILVDNYMPGMSGIDFMKYCKYSSELDRIPKIMITAGDSIEEHVRAFDAGAYDFITKPLIQEIVIARVKHVMETTYHYTSYDKIEQEYREDCDRDSQTGLLTQTAFRELSERILNTFPEDPMALYLIDIDNFNDINKKYGKETGDDILCNLTGELRKLFRKSDIIGRIGGDEFVVLLCGMMDRKVTKRKGAEVLKQVNFFGSREYGVNLSVSIGLVFTERNDNIDVVLAKADQALMQAKSRRKGITVVYGESVPPIEDDDKPIVVVCGDNKQLYNDIALGYGTAAAFAFAGNIQEIKSYYHRYGSRVKALCLDFNEIMDGYKEAYRWMEEKEDWKDIPMIAMCKEGAVEQVREAMKFDVSELMAIPIEIDTLQERLSYAIMMSIARSRK